MTHDKLRTQIAREAARIMYAQQESVCFRAKMQAASRLCQRPVKAHELPPDADVHHHLLLLVADQRSCETIRAMAEGESLADRFRHYASLLAPLEYVRQSPKSHPEGDALYHSLQVFALACDQLPYDEEFLLAALLHDVGKAIDPNHHVEASLAALEGMVTERTAWLIESHPLGHALLDGTLGARARRRLMQADSFEELMQLTRCDREGRSQGVPVPDITDALHYVRELAKDCGE